jgi:acetoin:2,6-dichlorophenolindophenol oxidoreductase subunit beta
MTTNKKVSYGEAICSGFQYLLAKHPNVFTIGQGLWAPWYVGNSMKDLDKDFGTARVIDSPVSEAACTGAAIGASLCGYRPIIVHPRMDFMLLTIDQVVNQAAKWSHMLGGQAHPAVTIRSIINRGGEQGAQHSQALHAWFAHIPGLRVVLPATVADARDLLIASVLCDDPVLYIDDRWLYELEDVLPPVEELDLMEIKPQLMKEGKDITLVGTSFSAHMCLQAASLLDEKGIACDVIDLRVINPLDVSTVIESVKKTGKLCVVDGGWRTCGLAGEVIVRVMEQIDFGTLKANAKRITLPDAPAPSSKPLEDVYYPSINEIVSSAIKLVQ